MAAEQILLVIGWRDGKRFKLGRVDTQKAITDHLAKLVQTEERGLKERTPVPFSVEATITDDEYFVAQSVVKDEEDALRAQLRSIGSLPLITVDKLEKTSLSFYGVVVGKEAEKTRVFIKKTNPLKIAKGGGLLALFGDSLSKLEEPVFTIAPDFDLIVYYDKIVILEEVPFKALFYGETGIDEKVGVWVEKISGSLNMTEDAKTRLTELGRKSVRLQSKLQAIDARGHLSNVTMSMFRAELKRLKIPDDRFVRDGKLIVPEKHERQLLEVLNEDLFKGGLSRKDFAAEKKSVTTLL